MPSEPPADAVRLRWQAYERFQQQIIASRIRPGQFVSQRELAALIDLPLGAIREVIPRLEAEGLLQTAPQRGLQIASVDVKLVRNAFQLRSMIEREAAASSRSPPPTPSWTRSKRRTAASSSAASTA